MLKHLSFKNYRSFKARQSINIKPMTLFIGPNSAGKSSIIKLIGLLKQNILMVNEKNDLIQYDGKDVQLKSFKNISYNHDENPIEISFKNSLYKDLKMGYYSPPEEYHYSKMDGIFNDFPKLVGSVIGGPKKADSIFPTMQSIIKLKREEIEIDYKKAKYEMPNLNDTFHEKLIRRNSHLVHIDNKLFYNNTIKTIVKDLSEMIQYCAEHEPLSKENMTVIIKGKKKKFERPGSNIDRLQSKVSDIIKSYSYQVQYNWDASFLLPDNENRIESLSMYSSDISSNDDIIDIKLDLDGRNDRLFKYKEYTKKSLLEEIHSIFNEKTTTGINENSDESKISANQLLYQFALLLFDWHCMKNEDKINIKPKQHFKLIKLSTFETFRRIKFYPALRPAPKEIYTKKELVNIFSIYPDRFDYKRFNDALKKLGYNYTIKLRKISDDHELYKMMFIHTESFFESTLAEMGYGFSQVLPFIAKSGELKVIEQPELHLHPKAQSLFPSILGSGHHIIETHSEHILRGIQLQVSRGILDKNDVAIYYVGKRENGNSYIKELKINDKGMFLDPLPEGFLFNSSTHQIKELLRNQ